MYFQELFAEALQEPPTALLYNVSRHLAASYPDRAMIEGCDCDFSKLLDFARAGRCTLRLEESIHNQVAVWWSDEREIIDYPATPGTRSSGKATTLDVVMMNWGGDCSPYHWILADSDDVARRFYAAVCGVQGRDPRRAAGLRRRELDRQRPALPPDRRDDLREPDPAREAQGRHPGRRRAVLRLPGGRTRSTASPGSGGSCSSARPATARPTRSRR